ncbi:hypothetical protein F5B22DRAFT_644671 [Xylaria bambusicola]|uniref:uncharacterized protein n=1 Tax=Xylaria bambusicola TaxID=326684 RepID=UPI002007BAD5|nr:uncharacterized protein F5B22DRAFT_644671 [Xylaria bambusicola]KAI0520930.1 hypothetical protein F5B22DRAFT_644671 [Xylaria bambusicola]
MSQRQNSQVRNPPSSSQDSREDEETYSTKATRGSSDAGSDDLESSRTRSRSSDRRPRRSVTRRLLQHIQTSEVSDPDTAGMAHGISSLGNEPLMGLSPLSPLPPAMLPTKKRSLDEVLGDQSPPEKDKMSAEIDELAGGPTSDLSGSSSGPRNAVATGSHQRKKSKSNGESSSARALPVMTRGSATDSEQHGNRREQRRSERIRNASHQDKPSHSR